ncbi:hypothetical protein HN51_060732 [Arachis hypogaea]
MLAALLRCTFFFYLRCCLHKVGLSGSANGRSSPWLLCIDEFPELFHLLLNRCHP